MSRKQGAQHAISDQGTFFTAFLSLCLLLTAHCLQSGELERSVQHTDEGALDFISLGALVHRIDPGVVPFRKASECQITSAAGFKLRREPRRLLRAQHRRRLRDGQTIGDLIASACARWRPLLQSLRADGVRGPNMAAVYSDRGHGVRAPSSSTTLERGGGPAQSRRIRRDAIFAGGSAGSTPAASSPALRDTAS